MFVRLFQFAHLEGDTVTYNPSEFRCMFPEGYFVAEASCHMDLSAEMPMGRACTKRLKHLKEKIELFIVWGADTKKNRMYFKKLLFFF